LPALANKIVGVSFEMTQKSPKKDPETTRISPDKLPVGTLRDIGLSKPTR
jgi:hypothetical protein